MDSDSLEEIHGRTGNVCCASFPFCYTFTSYPFNFFNISSFNEIAFNVSGCAVPLTFGMLLLLAFMAQT